MIDLQSLKGISSVKVSITVFEKPSELGLQVVIKTYIHEEFDLPPKAAVHALEDILSKLKAKLNNKDSS